MEFKNPKLQFEVDVHMFRTNGLTDRELDVVSIICEHPEPLQACTINKIFQVEFNNSVKVNNVLRRLERQGVLKADRRAKPFKIRNDRYPFNSFYDVTDQGLELFFDSL